MFLPALVCVNVCLSVTTISKQIVDGFVPNCIGRFVGGKEDQFRVSLRSVEGCRSNGQKTPKTGDCLHFIFLIVDVARVVKCWRQNPPNFAFVGSCTLSEFSI